MPLVIHAASTCDVCLESYDFAAVDTSTQPHAIACGHVFCGGCLRSLAHRRCPLCRSMFLADGIRKLHVDPTQQAIAGTPHPSAVDLEDDDSPAARATRFREDYIHFVLETRDHRRIRDYFVEINQWLKEQPADAYRDIRAQYLILYRHVELLNRQVQLEAQENAEITELRQANARVEEKYRNMSANYKEVFNNYSALYEQYWELHKAYTAGFEARIELKDRCEHMERVSGHLQSVIQTLQEGPVPEGTSKWDPELARKGVEQHEPRLTEEASEAIKRLWVEPTRHSPSTTPDQPSNSTPKRRDTHPQAHADQSGQTVTVSHGVDGSCPEDCACHGNGRVRVLGREAEQQRKEELIRPHTERFRADWVPPPPPHGQDPSAPPRHDPHASTIPQPRQADHPAPEMNSLDDWPPYVPQPLPRAPEIRRTDGGAPPASAPPTSKEERKGRRHKHAHHGTHEPATPRDQPPDPLPQPSADPDSMLNNLRETWRTQLSDFLVSSSPEIAFPPHATPPHTAPAASASFSYQNASNYRPSSAAGSYFPPHRQGSSSSTGAIDGTSILTPHATGTATPTPWQSTYAGLPSPVSAYNGSYRSSIRSPAHDRIQHRGSDTRHRSSTPDEQLTPTSNPRSFRRQHRSRSRTPPAELAPSYSPTRQRRMSRIHITGLAPLGRDTAQDPPVTPVAPV